MQGKNLALSIYYLLIAAGARLAKAASLVYNQATEQRLNGASEAETTTTQQLVGRKIQIFNFK